VTIGSGLCAKIIITWQKYSSLCPPSCSPAAASPIRLTALARAETRIEPASDREFPAEPDIWKPGCHGVDEDGRIYVVEDPGYPLNPKAKSAASF
jgi:hypothetical protein